MAANSYCTSQNIIDRLPGVSVAPTILTSCIEAASRMIDNHFGYPAGYFAAGASPADDAVKYFDGNGQAQFWLDDMLLNVTTLEIDSDGDGTYEALAATDYFLHPYNAAPYTSLKVSNSSDISVWPKIQQGIKITGLFGGVAGDVTAVPAQIREATIETATRLYKMGAQAFEDGARGDMGQIVYTKGLHPTVLEILDNVRRHGVII